MLHLYRRLVREEDRTPTPYASDLLRRAESISRQLGRWIESLKNLGNKGTRSQNDRTRAAADAERRRDEFLSLIREAQDQAIRRTVPSRHIDPDAEPSSPANSRE